MSSVETHLTDVEIDRIKKSQENDYKKLMHTEFRKEAKDRLSNRQAERQVVSQSYDVAVSYSNLLYCLIVETLTVVFLHPIRSNSSRIKPSTRLRLSMQGRWPLKNLKCLTSSRLSALLTSKTQTSPRSQTLSCGTPLIACRKRSSRCS